EKGIRRCICDICIAPHFPPRSLQHHIEGVDLSLARNILDWNLKRYPNGVFFLFSAGRISFCRSQPIR
ncbi:hypothetical protein AX14_007478, partial [Amanita brunnescens Koide BX004]